MLIQDIQSSNEPPKRVYEQDLRNNMLMETNGKKDEIKNRRRKLGQKKKRKENIISHMSSRTWAAAVGSTRLEA